MSIDPYKLCPCGSGKKVKFCCSKDITGDLEKVQRLLDGNQNVACLDLVNLLLKKYTGRAALLRFKAILLLDGDDLDGSLAMIDELLEQQPNNPVALADLALLNGEREGSSHAAIRPLQKALAQCEDRMPGRVYEVLLATGVTLLREGHITAGQAHLSLHASIGGVEQPPSMQVLSEFFRSPEVPILLKQEHPLAPPPSDVEWEEEFNDARRLVSRGAWLESLTRFEQLDKQYKDVPAIVRNLALVHSFLGDRSETVTLLRRYAQLIESDDLETAVEYEAFAQLLDDDTPEAQTDHVTLAYEVANIDALMERLLAHKQLGRMEFDPKKLAPDQGPPPKAIFWLLDRPEAVTGVDIAAEDIPMVIGQVSVYGRQTDREARFTIALSKTDDWAEKKKTAEEVGGEFINAEAHEEQAGQTSTVRDVFSWRWRLPPDTPPAHQAMLVNDRRRHTLLEIWPKINMPMFGDRPALDASADWNYRLRVQGAVLLLEMTAQQSKWMLDCNALRRKLGVPTLDAIDPNDIDLANFSLNRLSRVMVDKLSDEQLLRAYGRSVIMNSVEGIRTFATELVSRESIETDKLDLAQVYGQLAHVAYDNDQALEMIVKAKQIAVRAGQSPAQWLLQEMPLQLMRRDSDEFERLLNQLRSRHMKEPGIGQALFEMMSQFGLIDPSGRPAEAPEETDLAPVGSPLGSSGGAPMSGEPPAGASDGGEEKSKLWLPGME